MAYYRPPEMFPPVVKNLIIINALVYVAQLVFAKQEMPLENSFGLWSIESGNFEIWQLITHMFMHSVRDPGHLIFNMVGLWMFGGRLESVWGPKRFLQFYVICGIAAGVASLIINRGISVSIGASGAVMGLLAGFAYLFPNTQMLMGLMGIPIKAKWLVAIYMAADLFGGINPQQGDNTGHWAHLGGAVAGFIIVIIWNKGNRKRFY